MLESTISGSQNSTHPVNYCTKSFSGQYEMGECVRSGFCNFMHLKPISRELRRELYGRSRGGGGGGGSHGPVIGGGVGGGAGGGRRRSRSRDRDRWVWDLFHLILWLYIFSLLLHSTRKLV